MYSRGNNAYGQQSFAAAAAAGQQAYGQNSTSAAYAGSSIGGADGRHAALLGGSQDADNVSSFRAAAAQYGGQYGSVYGSSALSSVQQAGTLSGKVAGSPALQGRTGFSDSGDYSSLERRNYGDHQSAYLGRDLQNDPARRYGDSVGLGAQHQQPDLYDQIDQASLLRQQALKSQALQSASLDGGARQADYLAARGAAMRHATQDLRLDADPRSLSMLSGGSYAQHPTSILGAAPRRNAEDLMYPPGSSAAAYGVSLPPGRDYASGKAHRGASIENDYPSSLLSRGGHPSIVGSRFDDRADDRGGLRRDLDIRDEERRRREREKEREREKDRERERERDRERERERERERKRERERREKDRERERKRAPTPPRLVRDRHVSSSVKEERPLRRESPRRDVLHRRHSPVREKRREYICKIYPSSLVEAERDYHSISKRYPNLSISPDFSKVVLNWPKGDLKISLHTPVSFEHDIVELDSKGEPMKPSSQLLSEESENSRVGTVVWNAKVVLMSGMSKNAVEDLSSDKIIDDRIPHVNNMLRFAFLRKERSFMAIGGPWDVVDGGDPSVDDSSLVRTALRHAKDLVQLDLNKCQQWNRFLEIHYDRVGTDGLFSHKEITVLFVPDLSECLPSLNEWRDQWLAHRKAVIEKERLLSLKNEKPAAKDAVVKGDTKSGKDAESSKAVKVEVKKEKEKEKEEVVEAAVVEKKDEEKDSKTPEVQKPGKKKIVKKVIKQKVVAKKTSGEDSTSKADEKPDDKEASAEPSTGKTFVRKKVVKKVPVTKSAKKETEVTPEKKEDDSVVAPEVSAKPTTKKKIVKRVVKKKATADTEMKDVSVDIKKDENGETAATPVEVKKTPKKTPVKALKVEKEDDANKTETETKDAKSEKKETGTKTKDDKDTKKETKDDPKRKPSKETKEKGKPEEPPEHPGFILQAKRTKESKVRSMSLSLDSLLDYNDKDIEESTFELSLFAEGMYEMLQFQMGSRLLEFLQKLRLTFVSKRNQRKRQREEDIKKEGEKEKEKEKENPKKRLKTNDGTSKESESVKTEVSETDKKEKDEAKEGEGEGEGEGESSGEEAEETKAEGESDEYDPEEEEEEEEDQEMEEKEEEEKKDETMVNAETEEEKKTDKEEEKKDETVVEKTKEAKKEVTIDKELLQAFRFFDRNRVGYIKVEDMRFILHNLGKFLSHRDIKELVQSALLESNTARDNRILYTKLVRS